MSKRYEQVRAYIKEGWHKSIMTAPFETDYSMALPKPYTPPCYEGAFKTLIYWDAYFTNVGLIHDGLVEQAKDNVENLFYALDQMGYVPNGLARGFYHRSQPPLLTLCVKDIYETTADKVWLEKSLPYLEKEYTFWMEKRITPDGLNKYGNSAPEDELKGFWLYVKERLKLEDSDEDPLVRGSHFLAEAESGWDFCPRFEQKCEDYAPVDLNSILWINEKLMAKFFNILGNTIKAKHYELKAQQRKQLMETLMRNKEGIFVDYNYQTKTHSPVISSASFLPFYVGLAESSQKNQLSILLQHLEFEKGLAVSEKRISTTLYQWDFPNVWPPLVYFAVEGLLKYGFNEAANRIAKKYVETVTDVYMDTETLWEKYDCLTGHVARHNEYEITKMLGWTAGVYVHFLEKFYK